MRLYMLLLVVVLTPFLLHVFGFHLVLVLTDSMSPTIPPYSIVFTVPPSLLQPSNGSIVLYRLVLGNYSFYILHRIVGVGDGFYVTKGDARNYTDPWPVTPQDIVGVAVAWLPYGFYILAAAATTFIFLASFYAIRRGLEWVLKRR